MKKLTKIVKAFDLDAPEDKNAVNQAALILKEGGLVAIPTETVYGLAADATNPNAVKSIFAAKGRPQDNPLIVHVADYEMLHKVAKSVPPEAEVLMKEFWPGPLTIIMEKTELIPDTTSAGLPTVGVRMPLHPVALAIIKASGVPIAAPSANLSGRPSTTTAQHCIDDLFGKVDMIVDSGSCEFGLESTVISVAGEVPVLLRPGAVSYEEICRLLPNTLLHSAIVKPLGESEQTISPGLKYKHYSPNAQVILVCGGFEGFKKYFEENAASETYALVFSGEKQAMNSENCVEYGAIGDELAQAKNLFAALRSFDELGAKTVFVRCPDKGGVGLAVYNRLLRAAGFKEVYTDV